MRRSVILVTLAMVATASWGQSWRNEFQKNHVFGGLGFAVPGGDVKNFYSTAFAWSIGYGYRPIKYLQLDVGYDGSYNSANVDAYVYNPGFGPLLIRDFETFIPLGGRVVAPFAKGRVEFYAGGGGAYARVGEFLKQPAQYVRLECPYCEARDGWGYFAMLGASVALDRAQHFRLGAVTRVYRVDTSGPAVGSTPATHTSDQWVNTYFGMTFSF